jgi:hypothetical protein
MTQEKLQRLRSYYHSLLEQQEVLQNVPQSTYNFIDSSAAVILLEEIAALKFEFPEYVPKTDPSKFKSFKDGYDRQALRSLVGAIIGKLKVAIDQSETTPLVKPVDFPFVRDAGLRNIAERDFVELQNAAASRCWKSVILLSGGIIEAVLTDLLERNETRAKATKKAPKEELDIRSWGFVYLIRVAEELDLINPGVEKLSHSVRQYRDLVHPSVELRDRLTVAAEEAKIAMEVLLMLHRDLSK